MNGLRQINEEVQQAEDIGLLVEKARCLYPGIKRSAENLQGLIHGHAIYVEDKTYVVLKKYLLALTELHFSFAKILSEAEGVEDVKGKVKSIVDNAFEFHEEVIRLFRVELGVEIRPSAKFSFCFGRRKKSL